MLRWSAIMVADRAGWLAYAGIVEYRVHRSRFLAPGSWLAARNGEVIGIAGNADEAKGLADAQARSEAVAA